MFKTSSNTSSSQTLNDTIYERNVAVKTVTAGAASVWVILTHRRRKIRLAISFDSNQIEGPLVCYITTSETNDLSVTFRSTFPLFHRYVNGRTNMRYIYLFSKIYTEHNPKELFSSCTSYDISADLVHPVGVPGSK